MGPRLKFEAQHFFSLVGSRTPVTEEGGNNQPHDLKVERFRNEQPAAN
jgi:hypothetical protein